MRAQRSLKSAREFERAAAGRRARRGPITVCVAPAEPGPARLGLAVRASGAVARNRIKRRLRAAFRECGLPHGWHILVRADEAVLGRNFQKLVGDARGAIRMGTGE